MANRRAEVENAMLQVWGLFFTGALFIFGYQLFQWLRHGDWKSISVITGLRWLESSWAVYPREWLGVHKLLDFIPLSIALILLGLVPFLIAISWPAESKRDEA